MKSILNLKLNQQTLHYHKMYSIYELALEEGKYYVGRSKVPKAES